MTVASEQPITSAGRALHENAAHQPRLSADTLRPYIGIVGVLLGAILSLFGSRVTSFGLADLRGRAAFGVR
jgi:DHA2 family multidrug resistance protein